MDLLTSYSKMQIVLSWQLSKQDFAGIFAQAIGSEYTTRGVCHLFVNDMCMFGPAFIDWGVSAHSLSIAHRAI